MTYPTFNNGDVLPASDLNAIGLWLVKSQTVGTNVASVTVTDAFSAEYDNYLITMTGTSYTDSNVSLRLGSAVTGYYGSLIYSSYSSATVQGAVNNNDVQWTWCGGGGNFGTCYIEILQPFLATNTEIRARSRYATIYGTYTGHRGDAVSYSSFTLTGNGANFTGGTVRVYGFRK